MYVSKASTQELLAGGADARLCRLAALDMVVMAEAAKAAGVSNEVMAELVSSGRAISLFEGELARFPNWQFARALWNLLPELSSALGTNEGWALLAFLESPHGALEGRTPRQAIEQGDIGKVIELAKQ